MSDVIKRPSEFEPAQSLRPGRLLIAMFIAGACVYVQAYDAQAILPAISADQHVTASVSVLVLSATTVGMAIGVMPWAYLSDRVGRLRIIRVGMIAATIVSLLAPWICGFQWFLLLRLVKGLLFGGVTGLAVAFIFERLKPSTAAVATGVYISGNIIGGVATRFASGLVADAAGWRVALEIMALVGMGLAIAFVTLTWSVPGQNAPFPYQLTNRAADAQAVRTTLWAELRSARVIANFVQGFVALGVFNSLFSVLPFRMTDAFPDVSVLTVSGILALYALAFLPAQLAGRIGVRLGLARILVAGYVIGLIGLLLLFITSVYALVAGVALTVIGLFVIHPLNSAEAGHRVVQHRAQSTAIYQIGWLSGATLLGPIATSIFDTAGWYKCVFFLLSFLVLGAVTALWDHRMLQRR